jgi:molecular chaperone DnaK
MVESRLRKIFCRPGQSVMYHEPSRAVAYGAAIHASQLSGDASAFQIPPELKGVTGYHVGVRTVDPTTTRVSVDMVIKKNMPLPVKVRKTYYTSRPNQERVVLDFAQYQDASERMTSLGHLVVGPLAAPRPNHPVEVVVEYRVDGTVAAQAYDAQTGLELEQVFGSDQNDGVGNLAAQKALVDAVGINNAVL